MRKSKRPGAAQHLDDGGQWVAVAPEEEPEWRCTHTHRTCDAALRCSRNTRPKFYGAPQPEKGHLNDYDVL
jgi:hypothetical protein